MYVHEPTERFQLCKPGERTPRELLAILNGIVFEQYKVSRFGMEDMAPPEISYAHDDDDLTKDLFFRYICEDLGTYSVDYRINAEDGTVTTSTDEQLDLNDLNHIGAVSLTILRDLYGEFNTNQVLVDYFRTMGIEPTED